MSAITVERGRSPATAKPGASSERMPGGIALSAGLHIGLFVLILLGLPNLFRHAPPEDMPIAVDLVTIAPETHATHTNPFRPVPDANPEPAAAPPAPKPEPKPEPPAPTPAPSASAPPPPPPPPKPEVKTAEVPPPPPPKPVEAPVPTPPPPEPKPKAEPQRIVHHAPRAEPKKSDPAAFEKLLKNLETKKPETVTAKKPETPPTKKPEPAAFDSLLKNLTHEQVAQADDAPLQPHRQTAAALPSSQPKAPLGSQLTASEMDLLREQLYHCWNVPVGARDAKDLVIEIRVIVGPDGIAQQATIVDTSRLGDPVFRAAAESARRTFFAPECTPLRVPSGKYDLWKDMVVDFSPKDLL
ncbi:MAG: hypothetical protein JO058_14365 [Alphaproteobacteria bacterium]|nr:hypothetical protein [Alphaproteobacteria bacterium]